MLKSLYRKEENIDLTRELNEILGARQDDLVYSTWLHKVRNPKWNSHQFEHSKRVKEFFYLVGLNKPNQVTCVRVKIVFIYT